ncbi:PREDICTED: uncharacterized protein LOC107350732 isoform X2 [Acropora digitifera]|uniref:uncharacterized protein LOC107350732 isoform X1 n=1 Tax=Acropora digitifera TaxID=70779 RepID=UPI00077A3FA2|nr:PREDICTED: uncharacterized protein LOC107350732 isoform X1 [Acropora digitifera]XP_015772456.1 PREDICTED: uncharacterized protein LOC107350732 isoform X2 [Acropora digitifera]
MWSFYQGTASAPSSGEPTSAGTEGSAGPQWTIIGAVEGGIVVLAIVVVVVPWWVHKRRKSRKDITICNSELELRQAQQGVHLHVQCAQSGPLLENGTDGAAEQEKEVAGVIPFYAVVYKSKKSKKQADEKHPEAPTIPTYATVDESQKFHEVPPDNAEKDKLITKKKKIDKNIYAETLDEPKKITKPPVPLYANAGDFQNPDISTVSISPQPLPAIKEAYPYERMDYADIIYFPKGNVTLPPDDGNGGGNETETSKQKQGSRRD